MKAGERDRVGALRMLANALQQEAKLGTEDEVAVLQRMLGRDVRLVTAGHAVAAAAQRALEAQGLETEGEREGEYRFLCTGDLDAFRELGTRFLQMPLGEIEHIDLAH